MKALKVLAIVVSIAAVVASIVTFVFNNEDMFKEM